MSVERGRRAYPLKADSKGWGAFVPAWYLRLRLRQVSAEISRIERELAGEFGLAESAPQHREIEALSTLRDGLAKRLAARG